MVFNTGPYTVLPDNSILITANMQWETGFPSSHQLKSYVASKFRLKLAARAVLSADAGLLVSLKCRNSALPEFIQLLDFFNISDSRLILAMLYDSLNLVINAFSSGLLVQDKRS